MGKNKSQIAKASPDLSDAPLPARVKWTVADAKARFSQVIENAISQEPQVITRNGKQVAVVVGIDEWARKSRRTGTLAEFFRDSPLRDSGLIIERLKDGPREIDL